MQRNTICSYWIGERHDKDVNKPHSFSPMHSGLLFRRHQQIAAYNHQERLLLSCGIRRARHEGACRYLLLRQGERWQGGQGGRLFYALQGRFRRAS